MKVIAFLFILICGTIQAQQYGSLKGRVVSREDQSAIVGANVIVLKTVLGASTNQNGEFEIKRIPVGIYEIEISVVGFKRKVVSDIQIISDKTQEIIFELEPAPIIGAPIVVTASKREQEIEKVPSSISVLSEQKIFSRHVVTIDQALRHVPGVSVIESQINIRGASGYSKGAGSRVLVLIDGTPLLTGDTGELIFESIPTEEIQRIEVLKGAGSALYGSSAIGGVINIITKEIFGQPECRLRAYGGVYENPMYSEWRWSTRERYFSGISISNKYTWNDLGVVVSLSNSRNDSYRQNDSWKRVSLYSRLQYTLSSFDKMSLSFHFLDQRRENFFWWESLNRALQPSPSQIGDRVSSKRFHLAGNFQKYLSEDMFIITRAIWYRTRWSDNIGVGSTSKSNYVSAEGQFHWHHGTLHYITCGVEMNWLSVDANIFHVRNGLGSAIYLQDELSFSDIIRGTFGVRYDLRRLGTLGFENQVNPKLGVVFLLPTATSIRASVGRGFRSPSPAEAFTKTSTPLTVEPNPQLKAERSWSFEVGCLQTLGNYGNFDAALFWNELDDFIEPAFVENKVKFINLVRARTRGVELSSSTMWFERSLLIDLSYTYTESKDLKENKPLKFRPLHIFYSSAILYFQPFTFGIDFRFMSRVSRVDENLERLIRDGDKRVPIYVVDLHKSYEFKACSLPMKVSFHINNLLQYHYVELIGNIAPLRNYVLMLESTF